MVIKNYCQVDASQWPHKHLVGKHHPKRKPQPQNPNPAPQLSLFPGLTRSCYLMTSRRPSSTVITVSRSYSRSCIMTSILSWREPQGDQVPQLSLFPDVTKKLNIMTSSCHGESPWVIHSPRFKEEFFNKGAMCTKRCIMDNFRASVCR